MFPSTALWKAISQPFMRSQTGLFHGKTKLYGNNVPFSYKKTRRTWLPNVQTKRLPSEAIGGKIRVKLTTRALRTIKKEGGLDNYLMHTSSNLLGDTGMRLRMRVLEANRKKLGKPTRTYESPNFVESVTKTPKAVRLNMPASLDTARLARSLAAKVLGKPDQLASAEETIAFLREQAEKREARRSSGTP